MTIKCPKCGGPMESRSTACLECKCKNTKLSSEQRHRGLLRLIVETGSVKEAAARAGVAEKTLQYHMQSFRVRHNLKSGTIALVNWAWQNGLVYLMLFTLTAYGKPPKPVASFTYAPQSGQAPLSVQFTNTSTGNYNNAWMNFGDGSNAAVGATFSHTYTAVGLFTATLTVSGKSGSSVSDGHNVTVTNLISAYRNVTVGWTGPPSCTYTCYQGTGSKNYTRWIMTTNMACTFSNMVVGVSDYFAATATSNNVTSTFCPEIVYTP